jgi:hypothetical protein
MSQHADDSKPTGEEGDHSSAVKPGQGTEASLKGGKGPAGHKAEQDWQESPKESGE